MKLGISLVLESDVGASFAGLVDRELRDGTGSTRFDFAAHWRADNNNPALKGFLKLLAKRYPSLTSSKPKALELYLTTSFHIVLD